MAAYPPPPPPRLSSSTCHPGRAARCAENTKNARRVKVPIAFVVVGIPLCTLALEREQRRTISSYHNLQQPFGTFSFEESITVCVLRTEAAEESGDILIFQPVIISAHPSYPIGFFSFSSSTINSPLLSNKSQIMRKPRNMVLIMTLAILLVLLEGSFSFSSHQFSRTTRTAAASRQRQHVLFGQSNGDGIDDNELDMKTLQQRIEGLNNPYHQVFTEKLGSLATTRRPEKVHVVLFNVGTIRQGIHSIDYHGTNTVFAFETKKSCSRFADSLRQQKFFDPTVSS